MNISYLQIPERVNKGKFYSTVLKENIHKGNGYFLTINHNSFKKYYKSLIPSLSEKDQHYYRGTSKKIEIVSQKELKNGKNITKIIYCYNFIFDFLNKMTDDLEKNHKFLHERNLINDPKYMIIEDCNEIPMHKLDILLKTFPKTDFRIYTSKQLFSDTEVIKEYFK